MGRFDKLKVVLLKQQKKKYEEVKKVEIQSKLTLVAYHEKRNHTQTSQNHTKPHTHTTVFYAPPPISFKNSNFNSNAKNQLLDATQTQTPSKGGGDDQNFTVSAHPI